MRLGNEFDHIELKIIEVQSAVPGATEGGDVRVAVGVRSGTFAGAVDAWIARDDWVTFGRQLHTLERTRRGVATVHSLSPGDLRLTVRSLDSAGHLGAEGELTHHAYREGSPRMFRLKFGVIEFDPTVLPRLLEEIVRTEARRTNEEESS